MEDIKLALSAILFKQEAIKAIKEKKDNFWTATIILAIGSLIGGLLTIPFLDPETAGIFAAFIVALGFFGVILNIVFVPIMLMIGAMIINVVAKWFGVGRSWKDIYKVTASTGYLQIISGIPFLNWLSGLWGFILSFFFISKVYEVSIGKSIGIWVVSVIMAMIVFMILGLILTPLFVLLGIGAIAGAGLF